MIPVTKWIYTKRKRSEDSHSKHGKKIGVSCLRTHLRYYLGRDQFASNSCHSFLGSITSRVRCLNLVRAMLSAQKPTQIPVTVRETNGRLKHPRLPQKRVQIILWHPIYKGGKKRRACVQYGGYILENLKGWKVISLKCLPTMWVLIYQTNATTSYGSSRTLHYFVIQRKTTTTTTTQANKVRLSV